MASARSLSDVPEERSAQNVKSPKSPFGPRPPSTQPYTMPSAANSAVSLHPDRANGRLGTSSITPHTTRRTSSLRSIAVTAADLQGPPSSGTTNDSSTSGAADTAAQTQGLATGTSQQKNTLRRVSSTTLTVNEASGSGYPASPSIPSTSVAAGNTQRQPSSSRHRDKNDVNIPRMRSTPRLVYDKDAEAAPSTGMYWSRAPVFGTIPNRSMRAHSVTLVDNVMWLFGGCDEHESWRDIYCLDVGALAVLWISSILLKMTLRNNAMVSSRMHRRHTSAFTRPQCDACRQKNCIHRRRPRLYLLRLSIYPRYYYTSLVSSCVSTGTNTTTATCPYRCPQ